jgi:hypothetical protein
MIQFVDGATLTITATNGTVLLTTQTFNDDIGNEWKYRLGNGYSSIVITAIVAFITSSLLMLAIFYKREYVLIGTKNQPEVKK